MKLANFTLISILILATILRLFQVDVNPPAVYGDEISFAWNAWSILNTGTDEYGVKFPLQFRAFDDYKAPIPVYLLVPFIKIFGLNTFSIRLPVVVVSVITIYVTYVLTKKLLAIDDFTENTLSKKNIEFISQLTALLLTISPWHMHLSRGYFEATLALLPFLLGVFWFVSGLFKPKYFFLSSVAFAASLYTYFTPRIIMIFFLPWLFLSFKKQFKKNYYSVVMALVIILILCLPLIKLAVFDKGANRMAYFINSRLDLAYDEATREQGISTAPMWLKKGMHNRYVYLINNIKNDYLEHFSLNFWYLFGDNSLRYFLGKMGMFYLIEAPFFLIGLIKLWKTQRRLASFLTGWMLIAPIPSALVGRSFAIRSLTLLPVPFIIAGFGIWVIHNYLRKSNRGFFKLCALMTIIGYFVSLLSYVLRFHFDYPRYAATWWGWENKAAIDYAKTREESYDKIYLSDFYTGMPLALGFYLQIDPTIWKNARDNPVIIYKDKKAMNIGKYYIGSLDLNKESVRSGVLPPKSLYIGRPEEADGQETIVAPDDGRVIFKVHYSK